MKAKILKWLQYLAIAFPNLYIAIKTFLGGAP